MKYKIVFIITVVAPYLKQRFEEMAKDEDIELHIVVQNDTVSGRTGWGFSEIKGCHTYMLSSYEKGFVNDHSSSGYKIDNGRYLTRGMKKLVNSISPDIVIVCNSTQIALLYGPRKYRLGVVVEDTLRAAEGRKKINKYIKRILLKTADVYFPFSDDAVAFLRENGITSPLIPSSWSIDLSFFNTVTDIRAARNELGLTAERNIYTIVAALIPRKGIAQFLDGWMAMGPEFTASNQLNIIGDGELDAELKAKAADNPEVRFLGNLPYEMVSTYLQCSDVFVLPTLEDLCSLSVFEALAAGIPVLTTIYNGARFMVEEGKTGYVFDVSDRDSIINALNRIDGADISEMKKNAREKMRCYSNEYVMKDFSEKIKTYLNDRC